MQTTNDTFPMPVANRWTHPACLHVSPEFRDETDFFRALPTIFQTDRGRIIHDHRNQLRELEFHGQTFVVKSFARPHFINKIVYGFLRASKAERSFRYAELLRGKGLGSPQPVAYYTERYLGLFFNRSYYVSLKSALPYTCGDVIDGNLSPTDQERYLRALGDYTARLHEQGMVHKDYSRGNILFGDDAKGQPVVELIDLNRIRFHAISLKEGCENLMERLPMSEAQMHWVAEAYAKGRGASVDECLSLMSARRKDISSTSNP